MQRQTLSFRVGYEYAVCTGASEATSDSGLPEVTLCYINCACFGACVKGVWWCLQGPRSAQELMARDAEVIQQCREMQKSEKERNEEAQRAREQRRRSPPRRPAKARSACHSDRELSRS